jgi:hypothetical protein
VIILKSNTSEMIVSEGGSYVNFVEGARDGFCLSAVVPLVQWILWAAQPWSEINASRISTNWLEEVRIRPLIAFSQTNSALDGWQWVAWDLLCNILIESLIPRKWNEQYSPCFERSRNFVVFSQVQIVDKVIKIKFIPVLNLLSTVSWCHVGEWRYRSTILDLCTS